MTEPTLGCLLLGGLAVMSSAIWADLRLNRDNPKVWFPWSVPPSSVRRN
jgi:hypothetical protein